jgi:hypothetical protein
LSWESIAEDFEDWSRMIRWHSSRAVFVVLLAFAALTFAALAASGCTAVVGLGPASATQAPVPAASTAQAPAASAGASQSAASPSGASVAQGQTVVRKSCIGRCHGANILNFRTSPSQAQTIAASMGRRAGLAPAAQHAVALFFAQ